jgi:hemoglobin/transferrin/lactoferrin receptor protein
VSRGFRAPHVTDLGTLGLTGSGFEVAAPDVAGLGGTIGSTADATAISLGRPVEQVGPETSLNYEGGLHLRRSTVRSTLAVFVNDIHDNIVKQSLILPPARSAERWAARRSPRKAPTASCSSPPPRTRYSSARTSTTHASSASSTRSTGGRRRDGRRHDVHLLAREGHAHRPGAEHRRRHARARGVRPRELHAPTGRWWTGTYLHAAGAQSRLSTLDLDDRRSGAGRSRTAIRNFFINGATLAGGSARAPTASLGTADDVLT